MKYYSTRYRKAKQNKKNAHVKWTKRGEEHVAAYRYYNSIPVSDNEKRKQLHFDSVVPSQDALKKARDHFDQMKSELEDAKRNICTHFCSAEGGD